jgi:two-component system sensor histidine kinase ChvG
VVRGSVEGYRLAYPASRFELLVPDSRVEVEGSPDLAAQMLDKLAENAAGFSPAGTAVRVALEQRDASALLSVENQGARLPAELRGRLFDAMVSSRAGNAGGPHLGLGLYVARLIAEFHGGSVEATDLPAGDGVAVRVRLPLAASA